MLPISGPLEEDDVHETDRRQELFPLRFAMVKPVEPLCGAIGGTTARSSLCCAAMARKSHLDHLAAVPLFSACSKKELQEVARHSDQVDLPAGRTLCEQDSIGREAFVILEGSADVRRNNRKVATLGPGDCVGELALLDHGPRTATVTAATDVSVLVLGAREFSGLIDEVPAIAHKILKSLAGRVRELDVKTYG